MARYKCPCGNGPAQKGTNAGTSAGTRLGTWGSLCLRSSQHVHKPWNRRGLLFAHHDVSLQLHHHPGPSGKPCDVFGCVAVAATALQFESGAGGAASGLLLRRAAINLTEQLN
eukprot:CAMPEP_0119473056 /NCGR_PEP_ID=MMETSP1344-20130328/4864_1 /TAXON_ID=236787 /ORGANISM="Florenciella parvula, Strain CCMP2471" /LENGTH=112 /DNA_ID=CAMNT_0007506107 /DNA_START=48 /DNA_END=386 /DNA_ORIENTATION=-